MPKRKQSLWRRDYARLEDLATQGRTRKGIASELGMLWGDFQRELKRVPLALLRLERGEAAHEKRLLDRLHQALEVKNQSAITPAIFLLKSRHRWNDRPPPEPAQQPTTNVTIALPGALPLERYEKEITAHVERKQLPGGTNGESPAG